LIFKEWLSEDDFFGSFANVEKVINQVLEETLQEHKIDDDKILKDIEKRINVNYQGKYSEIIMGDYGEPVHLNRSNYSDILYKKLINGVDHYFRIRSRPLDDTDDNGNKVLTFEVTVKLIDDYSINGKVDLTSDFIQ
jgi:hypothetical protein